jgi:hypothetical protein
MSTPTTHDHICVETDTEESGIWLLSEAVRRFSPAQLADARPADCLVDIDPAWGDMVAARWLLAATSLLDDRRVEARDLCPESVQKTRRDVRHVANRYLGVTTRPPSWWRPDADGPIEDCLASWLYDAVSEVEDLLDRMGYVTQWENGGASTWSIVAHEPGLTPWTIGLNRGHLTEARYLGADAALCHAGWFCMSEGDALSILDDVDPKVLDRYPPPALGDEDQRIALAKEVQGDGWVNASHVMYLYDAWKQGRDMVWGDALQAVALRVCGEVGRAHQIQLSIDQRVTALQRQMMKIPGPDRAVGEDPERSACDEG